MREVLLNEVEVQDPAPMFQTEPSGWREKISHFAQLAIQFHKWILPSPLSRLAFAGTAATIALLCATPTTGAPVTAASEKDSEQPQSRPPNIVLIMTDDQGWGDLSCHGNPILETPNLDRLAAQGTRFNRFYTSPLCAPSRASLLTGLDHARTGTLWVTAGWETMRSDVTTIAEALKTKNYATGCFGKWHNGHNAPHTAIHQGFDEFVGFNAGHIRNYFDSTLLRNTEPVKTKGFITDVLTDETIRFIKSNKDRPFFAYVPYNAPHSPYQCPDQEYDKYRAKGLDVKLASIYGMIENVDTNVGRIVSTLEDLNLTEDTIVIFTTDNGPNGQRYNGGMRGIKGSVHEGGTRVPLIVRWPGKVPEARVVNEPVSVIDIAPTLAKLADADLPNVDGINITALLTGRSETLPDRYLYTHRLDNDQKFRANYGAVFNRTHRLTFEPSGPNRSETTTELFHIPTDLDESNPLDPTTNQQLFSQLSTAFSSWSTTSFHTESILPHTVGASQTESVDLTAVDAERDNIRFQGDWGWACDYIVDWTSETKEIVWRINVLQKTNYRIVLEYSAPEPQSPTMTAQVGNQTVSKKLSNAKPARQLPNFDRPHGDSQVEAEDHIWQEFEVGTLAFEPGLQEFKISAQDLAQPGFILYNVRLEPLR